MTRYFIGLISGTSVDGIDATLVDFDSTPPVLVGHYNQPISPALKELLLSFNTPGNNELEKMARADVELGQRFAEAAKHVMVQNNLSARDIIAIGSHGQTIRHYPDGSWPTTLQIGDPNIIAERTGITTVADFRRRDMAAGGEGAPLVPAFHAQLFQTNREDRAVLNIGGIANLTLLPSDPEQAITGFDTGPGNGLLDGWVQQHLKIPYDRDGEWGASGSVHPSLLERMLNDDYFSSPPPKSTGRDLFNLDWLQPMLDSYPGLAGRDVQATLAELTARSVADALQQYAEETATVLVCGGGAHNTYLMQRLTELLAPARVVTTAEEGVDPDWVEAMAFAWLARQTLEHRHGNVASVTGARHGVILGGVYFGS